MGRMNSRGFMRILEVLLVLTILFLLFFGLVQDAPFIPQSQSNLRVLQRHAEDVKNMVCNSEKDRVTIRADLPLNQINASVNYATPHDLRYSIVILDDAEVVVQRIGHEPPDLSSSGSEVTEVATSSCVMMKDLLTSRKVLVQVWYP